VTVEVIVGLITFAIVSFLWTQLPEEPEVTPG
jgi:hypothetical protein